MADYGGRPHWGKRHSLTAHELAGLYPRFEDFKGVRARLDPGGAFANPYTRAGARPGRRAVAPPPQAALTLRIRGS